MTPGGDAFWRFLESTGLRKREPQEEADESRTAGENLHGGADPVAAAGASLDPFGAGAFGTAQPNPLAAAYQRAFTALVQNQAALNFTVPLSWFSGGIQTQNILPHEPAPELLSEVVIGCRAWHLRGDTLSSLIRDTLGWPPRTPLTAQCQDVIRHAVPGWGCGCGVYAYRLDRQWSLSGEVTGLVGLWGRVIRHRDGWRGQYGYPLAFFAPPAPPGFPGGGVLALLAERYAVPLIPEAPDRWPAWLRRGEAR